MTRGLVGLGMQNFQGIVLYKPDHVVKFSSLYKWTLNTDKRTSTLHNTSHGLPSLICNCKTCKTDKFGESLSKSIEGFCRRSFHLMTISCGT